MKLTAERSHAITLDRKKQQFGASSAVAQRVQECEHQR